MKVNTIIQKRIPYRIKNKQDIIINIIVLVINLIFKTIFPFVMGVYFGLTRNLIFLIILLLILLFDVTIRYEKEKIIFKIVRGF